MRNTYHYIHNEIYCHINLFEDTNIWVISIITLIVKYTIIIYLFGDKNIDIIFYVLGYKLLKIVSLLFYLKIICVKLFLAGLEFTG